MRAHAKDCHRRLPFSRLGRAPLHRDSGVSGVPAALPHSTSQTYSVCQLTRCAGAVRRGYRRNEGRVGYTHATIADTGATHSQPDQIGRVQRSGKSAAQHPNTSAPSAAVAVQPNGSSVSVGNCWSGLARISMRRVGSGACMCAGIRTCSSDCSFMPAPSISVSGCGSSLASAPPAACRAVWWSSIVSIS